jgi:hypothetical protein
MAVSPEKGEGSSPGHIRTGSRVRSSRARGRWHVISGQRSRVAVTAV